MFAAYLKRWVLDIIFDLTRVRMDLEAIIARAGWQPANQLIADNLAT